MPLLTGQLREGGVATNVLDDTMQMLGIADDAVVAFLLPESPPPPMAVLMCLAATPFRGPSNGRAYGVFGARHLLRQFRCRVDAF